MRPIPTYKTYTSHRNVIIYNNKNMKSKISKNHSYIRSNSYVRKNQGFTLIEILIVVGIIGILSSVILVGLNSSRATARDSRRVTDLRQIQQGLELFYTKDGKYPQVTYDGLPDALDDVGVRKLPTDPLGGSFKYEYKSCDNGQSYMLKAGLESESDNLTRDSVSGVTLCGISCSGNKEFCVAS